MDQDEEVEPIEIIEVNPSDDDDDDDDGLVMLGGPPPGLIQAMMSDML